MNVWARSWKTQMKICGKGTKAFSYAWSALFLEFLSVVYHYAWSALFLEFLSVVYH
jgi:hypothetical protein